MPDYKKMYLRIMRASEDAIRLLIEAQQECEELYISEQDVMADEQSEYEEEGNGF